MLTLLVLVLLEENKIFHEMLTFFYQSMNRDESMRMATLYSVFLLILQEADRVTWSWGGLKAWVGENRFFRSLQPLLTTFWGSSRVCTSLYFGKQLLSVFLHYALKQFAHLKSSKTQDCIREILIHIIWLSLYKTMWCLLVSIPSFHLSMACISIAYKH